MPRSANLSFRALFVFTVALQINNVCFALTTTAPTVTLGTLQIAPVALGTVKLHKESPETVAQILEQLPANTLIDTGERYGDGQSETLLGRAMDRKDRPLLIATKYTPNLLRQTPNDVVEACRGSLNRLKRSHIDLYQAHFCASMLRYIVPFAKVLPDSFYDDETIWQGMVECHRQGLIQNVGVCNYGPTMVRRAYEYFQANNIPLVSNQINFNLLRAGSVQSTVDVCDELGIQVLGYKTLGKGILTGAYDNPEQSNQLDQAKGQYSKFTYQRILDASVNLRAVMTDIAKECDSSPSQVAVQWSIQKGRVPIVGLSSPERVQQVLQRSSSLLTDEQMRRLDLAAAEAEATGRTYMGKEFILQ